MTTTITLKAQDKNINDIRIEMSEFPVDFTNFSPHVVYEDKKYTINVNSDNVSNDDIEIYINDIRVYNTNIPQQFFARLYGLTEIRIETNDIVLYSSPLCIAINERNIAYENSIQQMIEEILSKESSFLCTKDCFENNNKNIHLHKKTDIIEDVRILKKIINTYNSTYQNFLINPYTRCTHVYKKEKTEKLNSLDEKTIQYIALHPNEFNYQNTPTGLTYNKMPIAPRNTLIKTIKKSSGIYENEQILGFLKTLYQYVDIRINEINNIINKKNQIKTKENLIDTYRLSTQIIEYFSNKIYIDSYNELKIIKKEIISLLSKYTNCFGLQAIPIKCIPKPTPVFIEIFHYRQIFSVIKEWFSCEHAKIIDLSMLLNFPSADKIYELYTLINMLEIIHNTGYKEINKYSFNYRRNDKLYVQTKYANTFEFAKDNQKLILYYQPVVHCANNKQDNGIKLTRTDKKTAYYYPDFIIKKEANKQTEYTILDAKWKTMKTVKDMDLKEIVYKYYLSIVRVDTQDFAPVSNLWLINGKEKDSTNNEIIYYHNKNSLSEQNINLKNRLGIVSLMPNYSKQAFNQIIQYFIN